MATIGDSQLTLLDLARRKNPDGSIATIVEMLTKRSPLLQDAVFKESNLDTGELVTSRTGLPSVTWRRLNEGVPVSKGRTDQFIESCGMIEARSEVDVVLANLGGNPAQVRAVEDLGHVQSMKNEAETAFFYASTKAEPHKIMGLAPRLDSTGNPGGSQIKLCDAGAADDQTSAYIVGWGESTVHGIFPKGSQAGLVQQDLGEIDAEDGSGNKYRAYATLWRWHLGLCVRDWRYVVRVANIDISVLNASGKTADNLIPALMDGLEQIEDLDNCRPVIYVNRKVSTYLWHQARNATKNSTLAADMIEGKRVMSLAGVPIRRTDAITNTEDVIS